MAELIQKTDTLNQGREKLNTAITDAETAKNISTQADDKATQALTQSESTQTQLDTIVINGDSSVEAAQARVDTDGQAHATLKARLDAEHTAVTSQLADNMTFIDIKTSGYKNINEYYSTDITQKFKDAITDIKEMANDTPTGSQNLKTLEFPEGIFEVNDTIDIKGIYGFKIKGVGRKQTILKFTGVNKDFFYINRSGYLKFEDLSIVSEIDNDATAFHLHMDRVDDLGRP